MKKNQGKKQEPARQEEWKRACDIKVIRTADPKVMLGKYIAERVTKKWTEEFVDRETGETDSVERKELLFEKGLLITPELCSQIMFSIQAEEIEDVPVTETMFNVSRFISNGLPAWEVSATSDTRYTYLVRAQSIEKAVQVAVEYAGLYLGLTGWVKVKQAKACDYHIIEDSDECIPENASEGDESEYEYYKVGVQTRFFFGIEDDAEKEDYTFIVKAQDVGQAKERTSEYCKRMFKDYLETNPMNAFVVLKAQPYQTDGIVPVSYCMLYHEKQEY